MTVALIKAIYKRLRRPREAEIRQLNRELREDQREAADKPNSFWVDEVNKIINKITIEQNKINLLNLQEQNDILDFLIKNIDNVIQDPTNPKTSVSDWIAKNKKKLIRRLGLVIGVITIIIINADSSFGQIKPKDEDTDPVDVDNPSDPSFGNDDNDFEEDGIAEDEEYDDEEYDTDDWNIEDPGGELDPRPKPESEPEGEPGSGTGITSGPLAPGLSPDENEDYNDLFNELDYSNILSLMDNIEFLLRISPLFEDSIYDDNSNRPKTSWIDGDNVDIEQMKRQHYQLLLQALNRFTLNWKETLASLIKTNPLDDDE